MASISFLVNGKATDHSKPAAWVTIEEKESGSLFFKVKQIGGSMGNLRGLFFDVMDESILNTLRIDTVTNDIRVSEEEISHLRNGTNRNETFVAGHRSYDANGKTLQTGIGDNGTSSYSFTLRSNARALTLNDFFHIQFDYSVGCGSSDMNTNDDDSHRWLYMGLV